MPHEDTYTQIGFVYLLLLSCNIKSTIICREGAKKLK